MPATWRKNLPEGLMKPKISYFKESVAKLRFPTKISDVVKFEDRLFAAVAAIEHEGIVFGGVAMCREGDQFNRKIGRNIAIGRAEKLLANTMNGTIGVPPGSICLFTEEFVEMLKEFRSVEQTDLVRGIIAESFGYI